MAARKLSLKMNDCEDTVVTAANQSDVTSPTLEIKLKNLTAARRKDELELHDGTYHRD